MTLLGEVVAVLRRESIPHAIIGAAALSAHGVARSTADVDLLRQRGSVVIDPLWATLSGHCRIDIRRGDQDDPLRGVVRFSRAGEMDVDIVVGREAWQRECLDRAVEDGVEGASVVSLPDLVLLKLYAGGPQDAWDIHQILGLAQAGEVAAIVESRASVLPPDSLALWRRIRAERSQEQGGGGIQG